MQSNPFPDRRQVLAGLAAFGLVGPSLAAGDGQTYGEDEMLKKATGFLGKGVEGMAKVIEKVFKEKGRPNGYITGEEASAALTVGLRYGDGLLTLKGRKGATKVYWAGPSIGIDAGANASKVFTLVYDLPRPQDIFERFGGVEGSLYFIGGVGVSYQTKDNITLAPIRLGVGLRTGASVGYLHYRPKKSYNPL